LAHEHTETSLEHAMDEEETERAWCETCGASRTRDEVREGLAGAPVCRTCGEEVEFTDEDEAPRAPWHFKVLLLGTIGYLIYRLIWFISWIQHR
jgi:uncharacterized protein (DUF983 family)